MRKQPSRRRVKARLRLMRWVPWSLIVDRDLARWGEYEHHPLRGVARLRVSFWPIDDA